MITQELADKIRAGYEEFVATVNKKGIRYINSQNNCDVLRKCMKDEGVPDESLALAAVWSLTWVQASAAGLLEEPVVKTAAQERAEAEARALRLEALDRQAGIDRGHRSEADLEAERQAAIERQKQAEANRKDRLASARSSAQSAAERAAEIQEHPERFIADYKVDQPAKVLNEMAKISTAVLKLWMAKRRDYLDGEFRSQRTNPKGVTNG